MIRILNLLPLISFCALIYWLSDQSILQSPLTFRAQDKVVHIGAYFIMGILAWRGFIVFVKKPINNAILCFVFCALFGFSDEWHQFFVPGRHCDIFDWYADMMGAAIATLIQYKMSSRTILLGTELPRN
jgi:VanZ family protein